MTTFTDSRYSTRDLIRSFAKIDEGFDAYHLSMANDPRLLPLQELDAKVAVLMSLPLTERGSHTDSAKRILSVDELQILDELIPYELIPSTCEEPAKNPALLREALRDKLYELLLRMDCSEDQLFSRYVIIPHDRELCLFHINQLVMHLAWTCVANARGYATSSAMNEESGA
jgi:hypothetical protein